MAGGLRASATRGPKHASYTVTMDGHSVRIRSADVVRPALELWRLRRALRHTPANGGLLGVPIHLRLGKLPTVTLRA